jgi:hypothetical protein
MILLDEGDVSQRQSQKVRRSRTWDVDDLNRRLAGRDPRQTHFDFYLAMTALLDRRPCQWADLHRQDEELVPLRTV